MIDYTYFYNCDCVQGAKNYLRDNSIDLLICDPLLYTHDNISLSPKQHIKAGPTIQPWRAEKERCGIG